MEKNKYCFFIPTIIHYLISFVLTMNFVNIKNWTLETIITFIFVEILFILILGFIYRSVFKLLKNKDELKKNKKYIVTFLIYFIILFSLLLCVWPGVWRWDDMFVAIDAQSYKLQGWQNILTSIFYILSYKFIPHFVGIVIIQCIFISIIVSYAINKIYVFLKFKNDKYKFLLYIPFILFPVLDNNLYPIRYTWSAYLMLLFLIKIIDYNKKDKLTWKSCVFLFVLSIILSSIRNEHIYLIVVFILMFFYFFKTKRIVLLQFLVSIILTILLTFLIYFLNYLNMGKIKTNNYKITGTIGSINSLVNQAYKDGEKELLNDINSVINIDLLLGDPEAMESVLYWNGLVKNESVVLNYNKYMKAFIILNLKYPNIVIKSRIDNINNVYRFGGINLYDTSILYDSLYYYNEDFSFFKKSMQPFNVELRKTLIRFLEGKNFYDFYGKTFLYKLWYIYPPIIINILFLIFLLIKRKWFYSFLYFNIIIRTILVFFTQPSFLFMYYFQDYLIGYITLIALILLGIQRIKIKYKNNGDNI